MTLLISSMVHCTLNGSVRWMVMITIRIHDDDKDDNNLWFACARWCCFPGMHKLPMLRVYMTVCKYRTLHKWDDTLWHHCQHMVDRCDGATVILLLPSLPLLIATTTIIVVIECQHIF